MRHRLHQYFAIERFIVRDDFPSEQPFVYFGEMAVESLLILCVRGFDAMHEDVVIRIMVEWRLDQRVIFIGNDSVIDRHDPDSACTFGMMCSRFEIYGGESHF